MDVETVKISELLKHPAAYRDRDVRVAGVPTGWYADRSNYGTLPALALILDGGLPCRGVGMQFLEGWHEVKRGVKDGEEEWCASYDRRADVIPVAAAFLDIRVVR